MAPGHPPHRTGPTHACPCTPGPRRALPSLYQEIKQHQLHFCQGEGIFFPGSSWGGGEVQGLGRRVQPGAAFKQSRCLCPQTASLNTERGRKLPASTLGLLSHPEPPQPGTGSTHLGGAQAANLGPCIPPAAPSPRAPIRGAHTGAQRTRPGLRGRLELARLGLIWRFLRCSCSSQLLPSPKRGRELAASASPAAFLLTSFLLNGL